VLEPHADGISSVSPDVRDDGSRAKAVPLTDDPCVQGIDDRLRLRLLAKPGVGRDHP